MRDPKSILITGGSSGIGEALAVAYAAPGVTLALTGRDQTRLEGVLGHCRNAGAEAWGETVDVTDVSAMAEFIQKAHEKAPLDLVIANAGISGGTGAGSETGDQMRQIMNVNVDGVINTLDPAIMLMKARSDTGENPKGQVAIVSSLAGFRGFPGAPAYCGSKAAVKVLGEALRGELEPEGLEVSVICPGFVVSRMTDGNGYKMPLLMTSDKAARIIRKGLARNKGRIAFPFRMYFLMWLISSISPAISDWIFRRLPKKV